ncbi:MAG: carboxypeptidase regulatory-like domain-containing protein [Bryobacteraceae bacterium]|nr:carboxypeptidase regulatory-like domain-containing protein [Bryobacteraceae bacterium]
MRHWGVLLLLALAAPAAAQYRIAGQVVNSVTGAPLARARVMVAPVNDQSDEKNFLTGDDGRFRFEGLAAGKYMLYALRLGYPLQTFGQRALGRQFASALAVGPEHDTSNIRFPLIPGAVIAGRVTDEAGDPADSVLVKPIRLNERQTLMSAQPLPGVWTNDRGEYRIHTLPAGVWTVVASGTPTWSMPGDNVFLATYHPDATNPALAKPLTLRAGETVTADIRLTTAKPAMVMVDIKALGLASPNVRLMQEGPDGAGFEMPRQSYYPASDSVTIPGLPPGRYTLLVGPDQMSVVARLDFTASSGGEHQFTMERNGAQVGGKVKVDGPSAGIRGEMFVMFRDLLAGALAHGAIQADGSFRLPELAPGRYLLAIGGRREAFTRSVTVEGAGFADGFVDVTPKAEIDIQVVLDTVTFPVAGVATSDSGPAVGVYAVLVPVNSPLPMMQMRMDQTDSDGTFLWPNLVSGEYLAFAAAEGEDSDYADAGVRAKYLKRAVRLKISPDMETPVRIPLVTVPE